MLRDKDHIDKVLNRLKVVWNRYPTLRLMQLLGNVSNISGALKDGNDKYYCEDNELVESVEKFYHTLDKVEQD